MTLNTNWNSHSLEDDLRDTRRLYDIFTVLHLSDNKKKMVCPLPFHPHHNNTPSFSVWNGRDQVQRWTCHGACGKHGDVIDLVGYMQVPNYDPKKGEDVFKALSFLRNRGEIAPPVYKKPITISLPNDIWERYPIGKEVIEYATSRGLSMETIEKFRIGQLNSGSKIWMTMPAFHGARLIGIKTRNLNPENSSDRYRAIPGSKSALFNLNAVDGQIKPIVIAKGEIAAMILDQHGILACAPTGGEASWDTNWYLHFVFSTKTVIIGDNDPSPMVREKMMEHLAKRAKIFHGTAYVPPEEYKDADEWVLAEGMAAINQIKEWMK